MQPPMEDGADPRHLGCERAEGAAAPGWLTLATAFARWVGG